jgi:hypothetical protein
VFEVHSCIKHGSIEESMYGYKGTSWEFSGLAITKATSHVNRQSHYLSKSDHRHHQCSTLLTLWSRQRRPEVRPTFPDFSRTAALASSATLDNRVGKSVLPASRKFDIPINAAVFDGVSRDCTKVDKSSVIETTCGKSGD